MVNKLILLSVALLSVLAFTVPASAQISKRDIGGSLMGDGAKSTGSGLDAMRASQQLSRLLPPLERSIDPETYRLGPNDHLMISIPLLNDGNFPVFVSIDGKVVLPRGFSVYADGMTLATFQRRIDSLYKSRQGWYDDIKVSLVVPRPIYVTISGAVSYSGPLMLTAADRVTSALIVTNLPDMENLLQRVTQGQGTGPDVVGARDLGNIATEEQTPRRVVIRHNDGTSTEIDLLRYRAFGDAGHNPTLREGDQIIVPPTYPAGGTISIVGAVNLPISVPYLPGDNALLLQRLSGGIRFDGLAGDVYLSRPTDSGLITIPMDWTDSSALRTLALLPGDQVIVPGIDRLQSGSAGIVSVNGEVIHPSVYPIVPGVTKLTTIIERAGGFTSEAALNGAYIVRPRDPDRRRFEQAPLQLASRFGSEIGSRNLGSLDSLAFALPSSRQNRVSLDFVRLFEQKDRTQDVTLENGDIVVVPSNSRNVFVRGRVTSPGWIRYVKGTGYEQYVDACGGFTELAETGHVMVIKYGTGEMESADETEILPGDEIYVPTIVPPPPRTSLEIANTVVGITGAIVSLTLAVLYFVRTN